MWNSFREIRHLDSFSCCWCHCLITVAREELQQAANVVNSYYSSEQGTTSSARRGNKAQAVSTPLFTISMFFFAEGKRKEARKQKNMCHLLHTGLIQRESEWYPTHTHFSSTFLSKQKLIEVFNEGRAEIYTVVDSSLHACCCLFVFQMREDATCVSHGSLLLFNAITETSWGNNTAMKLQGRTAAINICSIHHVNDMAAERNIFTL